MESFPKNGIYPYGSNQMINFHLFSGENQILMIFSHILPH